MVDVMGHLNTIKEMILDEERLLTNAVISKELCIHVNLSKILLNAVVEDIRKKQEADLNINYIVSGLCEDNKAQTIVCSETDIQSIEKSMKKVFFKHIYSINKGSSAVDHAALKNSYKFEDFPLCTGLIKSDACIKRSSKELGSLKTNSQDVTVTVPSQKSKSAIIIKNKIKEESVVEPSKVQSEPIFKKEQLSPVKISVNKQKSDAINKSQKGIAGLFNKQNRDKKSKLKNNSEVAIATDTNVKPKKGLETKADKNYVEDDKMDVDLPSIKIPKEDLEHKNIVKTESSKVIENYKNNDKKKLNGVTEKKLKVDKKRKRVLLMSDSESDNEKDPFADDETPAEMDIDEAEDEIPPTPTTNIVKVTSGITNPKKKRKVIDKTYTDEEGYVLTKKVEVYESCSESEHETDRKENVQNLNHVKNSPQKKNVEISPKEKKGPKNTKKKISPKKGKQATLMNFFKKA